MSLRIIATTPTDSSDVTEAVRALYDLAINSMDYGSGFWTEEDATPVWELAKVCGFGGAEALEKYIESEKRAKAMRDRLYGVSNAVPNGGAAS